MSETRYGVISDVHINPGILPMIIDALRKEKLDGLFLNGDIGEDQRSSSSPSYAMRTSQPEWGATLWR